MGLSQGSAMHKTAVAVKIDWGRGMERSAVIPQYGVSNPPDMTVNEYLLRGMRR